MLDIDNKNGINGLLNLNYYMIEKKIIFLYDLKNIPFYVQTPSGGFHFYFLYSGKPLLNTAICQGVEIKHSTLITAPGCKNKKGEYIAIGEFLNIPIIPYSLIKDKLKKQSQRKPYRQYFQKNKNISLDKIYNTVSKQYGHPVPGNRNNYSFQFSCYAGKQGFSFSEIKSHLSFLISEDFPEKELAITIKSGIK